MRKMAVVVTMGVLFSTLATRNVMAQGRFQEVMSASYAAEANKDIAGAMKTLKGAEQTEGDNYLYRLRLGWLAYLAGMWNESIAQYEAAANLAPEAVEPLQGMLLPLAAAGKTADIQKTHERILKVDSNNYKSLSQAAWLSYSAKDYKRAEKHYTKLLRLYPSDVEMMLGLGYSLKLDGNKDGADRTFKQVLLLSPKNVRATEGLK